MNDSETRTTLDLLLLLCMLLSPVSYHDSGRKIGEGRSDDRKPVLRWQLHQQTEERKLSLLEAVEIWALSWRNI